MTEGARKHRGPRSRDLHPARPVGRAQCTHCVPPLDDDQPGVGRTRIAASPLVRFKASYRHGRAVATVDRALSALRRAINWGRFQDLPLPMNSPFHRFGVTIRAKDETRRDRRVGPGEEKALLDAALTVNSEEHRWAGASMHDRIIGALETCCRQGEILRIQPTCGLGKASDRNSRRPTQKDSENRRVPFDPQGRLAPVLKRRGKVGPSAFVFGSPQSEYQDSFKTAWESLLLQANGLDIACEEGRTRRSGEVGADRSSLARSASRGRLPAPGRRPRHPHDPIDARACRHQQTQRYLNITDEELRKAMTGVLERRRQLRLSTSASRPEPVEGKAVGQ